MNKDYGELVTAVNLRLNFDHVMKGHLVLLSRQLNSGVLGSVAVGRTLFAGNIRYGLKQYGLKVVQCTISKV